MQHKFKNISKDALRISVELSWDTEVLALIQIEKHFAVPVSSPLITLFQYKQSEK